MKFIPKKCVAEKIVNRRNFPFGELFLWKYQMGTKRHRMLKKLCDKQMFHML
jgi:hypothetical protein